MVLNMPVAFAFEMLIDLFYRTDVEDISDKKLLVNMLLWAVDNPPPSNYLMISGDHYFFNALCELSERGYNILRAQPRNGSGPLLDDANVWVWTSLSVGGAPFQSADSSLPPDAANAEMSKDVSSDPLHGKLLVEFVPESFQLGNQKGSDNSVLDNNFKGKWQWRSSTQYNMPRTSSTEFWLPPAETQGDSSDESYDASSQKGMSAIPQQNEVPTSKSLSIKSQGSSQPNCTRAGSSLFHPTPLNVPGEGNFPLQPTSSFPCTEKAV
ncbi:hypothetical protein AAC387_Pa09g0219 [Persea americana]